ncbi:MAG: CDP-alcohol phosphatidyltransferase family protein [Nanoarchaeota archaeon]
MDTIEKFRIYRSRKLNNIAKIISKIGISANNLTFLSLCSGLAAVYFLFNSYYLFALFALLHLVFDAFDGVVARLNTPTRYGKYFDLLSDNIVTVLTISKAGYHLQDSYAYLAAGLFLLALLIHLTSKLEAPMLFMRTASLITLMIATHSLFPFTTIILNLGYLAAGGVSLFSLARQLQWHISKN